jgi:hypothetical protein
MLVSLISLLLLVVAAYFLIITKPNLFLFELMKEVFGAAKDNNPDHAGKSLNEKPCALKPSQKKLEKKSY